MMLNVMLMECSLILWDFNGILMGCSLILWDFNSDVKGILMGC